MDQSAENVPSRRQFAYAVLAACGGAVPAIAADEEPKLPDAKAYAEAMETIVRYRFGKLLSDEQIKRVAASAVGRRASAESLKKYKLENGDDPAAAFRADLP